jgi:hypothetical protein
MRALVDEVKRRTREALALLRAAADLGASAAEEVESVARDFELRMARDEFIAVVVGSGPGRRALFDAVLDERVFGDAKRQPSGLMTRVRRANSFDYAAHLRNGIVIRFREVAQGDVKDRSMVIAQIERDSAVAAHDARQASAALAQRVRDKRALPLHSIALAPTPGLSSNAFVRAWRWLVALIVAWLRRAGRVSLVRATTAEVKAREPSVHRAVVEASLRDAQARLDSANTRLAGLEFDRRRDQADRRDQFFAELRSFADGTARGNDVIELFVELPSEHLPTGLTLVDAPQIESGDATLVPEADGCLFVTDGSTGTRDRFRRAFERMLPVVPHAIPLDLTGDQLHRWMNLIRSEAPVVAGRRIVRIVRERVKSAAESAVEVEAACRERIASLESQLSMDPSEFRVRAIGRMRGPIEGDATEVVRAARACAADAVEHVKAEWRGLVDVCADRKAVEGCVRRINEGAPSRLATVVEGTNSFVLDALQRCSDRTQRWLLQEICEHYDVALRTSIGDGGAPVIAEVSEPPLAAPPLAGAMDAFESKRVGFGLGGAAAGAVIGTFIAPVLGTAIGAFVGVFAGFFKGLDALKTECIRRLEACLDEVAQELQKELGAREHDLATALGEAFRESLDAVLARYERPIADLIEVERSTLQTERSKAASLAKLHVELIDCQAALDALGVLSQGARPPACP